MSQPGMWLEIRRGKTNFPLRPISGDRFLIGAGSHCHLQLGGEGVPMLHSLLVIEGQKAYMEAVVAEPPLLVNGEVCREVQLSDEDIVAIGDFEFVFHRLVSSEPAAQVAARERHSVEVTGVTELSQLSTHELVALIEDESRQITEFQRSRELGAAALLDAAHQAGAEEHPASVPMVVAFRQEPTVELLADPLKDQSQRLAEREAECLLRATQLQEAQHQLATQMAEFAKQVATWHLSSAPSSRRVSA